MAVLKTQLDDNHFSDGKKSFDRDQYTDILLETCSQHTQTENS